MTYKDIIKNASLLTGLDEKEIEQMASTEKGLISLIGYGLRKSDVDFLRHEFIKPGRNVISADESDKEEADDVAEDKEKYDKRTRAKIFWWLINNLDKYKDKKIFQLEKEFKKTTTENLIRLYYSLNKKKVEREKKPVSLLERWKQKYPNSGLSPSSIAMYNRCPRRWYYSYDPEGKKEVEEYGGIPEKAMVNTWVGHYIHHILEWFLKEIKAGRIPSLDRLTLIYNNSWGDQTNGRNNRSYQEELNALELTEGAEAAAKAEGLQWLTDLYSDYVKRFHDADISIEVGIKDMTGKGKYHYEVGEDLPPLTGRIDILEKLPEGGYSIGDIKNTKEPFDKAKLRGLEQMRIYQMIINDIEKKKGDIANFVKELAIYHPPTGDVTKIPAYTEEEINETKKKIQETTENILEEKFDPVESSECNRCEFKDTICPLWSSVRDPVKNLKFR